MAPLHWILWLALAVAASALSVLHYRRRETPGRGRMLLAALRGLAVALLLLLLFDPELPVRGAAPAEGTQVVLDASLSMRVPVGPDETAWDRALHVVRTRHGARPVMLFGDRPRPVGTAALPNEAPGDPRSLLLPALQAAAEAGVRRVVVVTDGGIEDADAVARWAPRLGIELVVEGTGTPLPNRSLTEVSAPPAVESGAPFTLEFAVSAPSDDSIAVVARSGGAQVARTVVAGPAVGRLAAGSMQVTLTAPAGGAVTPLEVALEGVDAVPDDDQRTVYVHVSEQPAGVALVSFRPDWEPRFLAPVLRQSLGLPVHAFLAGAAGRWVRLAGGLEAGRPVDEAEVRRAIAGAELVVLHAVGAGAPDWALEALRTAPRLLVFPTGDGDVSLPVAVGLPQPGDFFPSSVPASPVAPLLAGQELTGVAPLAALMPADAPAGAWAPLLVTRGRQGAQQPVAVGGGQAGRRWVVVLGSGSWQWAFRGGEERQLYNRLWGAVAGWLVRERRTAGLPPVRPAALATPRGAPIPWIAIGMAVDSIAVRLTAEDGTVVTDTVVAPTTADTAWTAAVPPARYGYRAIAWAGDVVAEAEGPFTVERYSPEFARPAVDPAALRTTPAAVRGTDSVRRGGIRLHATPFPYIILVLLLATEWILRRRWGLR
jgi:hypothetical protein